MKNKLEKIVENLLIKHLTPAVAEHLSEATELTQMYVPSLVSTMTPAGQSLSPGGGTKMQKVIKANKIFRVIKTVPLVQNLIQLGLIPPPQMPQEQEAEVENDVENPSEQEVA
jgi:hypothetical protein